MTTPVPRTRIAAYGLAASEDKVLLARASDRSALPGTWWLPGGGGEFGEPPADAVVREFVEETGLMVRVVQLLGVLSDVADRPDINERMHTVRIIYAVEVTAGELTPEVAGTTDAVAWVARSEAEELPLMSFFRPYVSAVTRSRSKSSPGS